MGAGKVNIAIPSFDVLTLLCVCVCACACTCACAGVGRACACGGKGEFRKNEWYCICCRCPPLNHQGLIEP